MHTWERFTSHGFVCFVNKGPYCWTGYVGLPAGHPWAEEDDYDAIPVEIHGGLTFSSKGHAKAPIGTDAVRWIGWDAGHGGDEDWTIDQARAETVRLAEQVRAAAAIGDVS